MDLNQYEKFAAQWQQIVSSVKMGFIGKTITATANFRKSYKIRTGREYDPALPEMGVAPVAVEPAVSKCKTPAIGCYVFMPNGHVYEGVVRTDPSPGKSIVHLVWFCHDDASKRSPLPLDMGLFKKKVAPVPKDQEKEGDSSTEG